MKITFRNISVPVALSAITLAFAACGQGGGSTPITSAPQTENGKKLSTCADAKLSNQAKTFLGAEATVCRVRDGKMKDEPYRPIFSAVRRDKRIGVYQRVAFKLTERDSEGKVVVLEKSMTSDDIAEREQHLRRDVLHFLNQVCRPISKRAFTRVEVVGDAIFIPKTNDIVLAQPTSSTLRPGSQELTDEPFGGTQVVQAPPKKDGKDAGSKTVKETIVTVFAKPSEYHSVLSLDITGEGAGRRIKIADEFDALWSGIVVLEAPGKPTDEQVRFCNQLAMRVGETFGLLKGRDCASRAAEAEAVAASPAPVSGTGKKASNGTGLMKAGNASSLDPVKVSEEEVLEVIKPVCGSI